MKNFSLPDNYFEDFASKMDEQIRELSAKEEKAKAMKRRRSIMIPIFSAAAAVTIILSSVLFLETQESSVAMDSQTIASVEIKDMTNEEYVELLFEELDEDVIDEIIAEVDYNY